jgi:transcriptional regulator with XRE-family HTH domain
MKERSSTLFAQNMRKLRETHGYTCAQLADLIGVTRSSVSRWETNSPNFRFPNSEYLDKICDVYKISLADLFRVEGAAEKSMALQPSQEDALIIVNRLLAEGKIQLRMSKA